MIRGSPGKSQLTPADLETSHFVRRLFRSSINCADKAALATPDSKPTSRRKNEGATSRAKDVAAGRTRRPLTKDAGDLSTPSRARTRKCCRLLPSDAAFFHLTLNPPPVAPAPTAPPVPTPADVDPKPFEAAPLAVAVDVPAPVTCRCLEVADKLLVLPIPAPRL